MASTDDAIPPPVAVGDMASSLDVGGLLQAGRPALAFGLAATVGSLGIAWMLVLGRRAITTKGGTLR